MKLVPITLLAFVGCCATEEPKTAETTSALMSITYPLASFPDGFEADDVTGDERLVFTAVLPSASVAPGVVAARRIGGSPVGSLPPPVAGFALPTCVKVVTYTTTGAQTSGELVVVDNGGLPPAALPVAHRYSYSWGPVAGFSATLLSSTPLPPLTAGPPSPPNGIGYASGLLVLDPTTFVITDAFVGGAWVCDASFSCFLGVADPSWGPGPAGTFTGVGRAPGGGTRSYTFVLPIPIFPGLFGAAYVALTDEVCVERAAAPGGLWCVDRATLLDPLTSPLAKSPRAVVPPIPGVSDAGHGIAADRWHPASPWLYWARSFDNTIRRVNVQTLAVETVASSVQLFDFPTGLDALPPLFAGSPLTNLAVAMGQEEWNAALNVALGGVDDFVAPTIIAGVALSAM